jgi:hypothetical protein
MVYGLNVKPEHGYYVNVDPLDGDISRIEVVDQTADDGLQFTPTTIQAAFTMGRPIKTNFVPTKMTWDDPHGHSIPDFDSGWILNVSSRAKDLIENLEPGVHQFLPVDYFDTNGRFVESRWFLIVCNRIDSVDRNHSRMHLAKGVLWSPIGVDDPKLVFNEEQARGYHLWRDKHLTHGPFISDILADGIQRERLTGFGGTKADSV